MVSKSEHPVKKFFMKWIWRVQQVSMIAMLILTAFNLTLTLSARIEWRIGSPYIATVATFTLVSILVLAIGWVWDKPFRMWNEQNVVNAERNPYNMHKWTPKEIAHFKAFWIPLVRSIGGRDMDQLAENWDSWCEHQLESDSQLSANWSELKKRYFQTTIAEEEILT
jgi:hypothetical protein